MEKPQGYHIMTRSLLVKPTREPIFSEMATEIRVEDEDGGMFIEIEQSGNGLGKITINPTEWDIIKQAVEQMLGVIKAVET